LQEGEKGMDKITRLDSFAVHDPQFNTHYVTALPEAKFSKMKLRNI
jgi:hypothetical protein